MINKKYLNKNVHFYFIVMFFFYSLNRRNDRYICILYIIYLKYNLGLILYKLNILIVYDKRQWLKTTLY